jgi:hypothetical protein
MPLSVPVSWAPNLGPACPPSWHADVCMTIEPASWPDIVQLPAPAAADVEIVGVDVKVGVLESPLAPHARHNVATSARVVSNGSIRITSDYRVRTNRIARRARAATLTHRYAKPISMVRLGSYRTRSLTRGCPVHRPATPNRSVCHVPARRPRPARQMSIYGRQIWLKNGLNFNTSEMLIRLSAFRSKRRCRETRTYGVEHPAVLQHVRRLFLTEGETELERDNRLATEPQDVLPAFKKS